MTTVCLRKNAPERLEPKSLLFVQFLISSYLLSNLSCACDYFFFFSFFFFIIITLSRAKCNMNSPSVCATKNAQTAHMDFIIYIYFFSIHTRRHNTGGKRQQIEACFASHAHELSMWTTNLFHVFYIVCNTKLNNR